MAPTVLVIGGGFAGAFLAKGAQKAGYTVVLVDKKAFFDVTIASLRAAVKPELVNKYAFEYSKIPGIGTFKQASVVSLTNERASLDNGEEIKFDFCVIATGSTNRAGVYAQPQGKDIASRKAELNDTADRIKNAKSIIIVGAGAVGVELAAEIVEEHAGKSITLVHSGKALFEGKPAKVGKAAMQWLKDNKVQVLTEEKAQPGSTENSVVLKSGEQSADLVIWAAGARPNTGFLEATEFKQCLDAAGRVKVDADLRVAGYKNIFALGDINDVKEDKLGYLARLQAELTVKNLAKMLKNRDAKLVPWVPSNGTPGIFLSLGAKAGAGALGGCVFPSCMVAGAKSKDLFIGKFRADLGVK